MPDSKDDPSSGSSSRLALTAVLLLACGIVVWLWPADDAIDVDAAGRSVDLILKPGGVELRGTVLDISGGILEGAQVWSGGAMTETDDKARFSLWVEGGVLLARANADGYAPGSDRGAAPGHDFEVLLPDEQTPRRRAPANGAGLRPRRRSPDLTVTYDPLVIEEASFGHRGSVVSGQTVRSRSAIGPDARCHIKARRCSSPVSAGARRGSTCYYVRGA